MKHEKAQLKAQITKRAAVMTLLAVAVQLPVSVVTGLRNWKRKTVPVGRSLMRLPSPVNVFPVRVWEEEEDEEDVDEEVVMSVVINVVCKVSI